VSTLVGHTQSVSSLAWPEHKTIYSASWDHSVRLWDVETGKDTSDIVSENIHTVVFVSVSVYLCMCVCTCYSAT
jgi:WD40 repeat protein